MPAAKAKAKAAKSSSEEESSSEDEDEDEEEAPAVKGHQGLVKGRGTRNQCKHVIAGILYTTKNALTLVSTIKHIRYDAKSPNTLCDCLLRVLRMALTVLEGVRGL